MPGCPTYHHDLGRWWRRRWCARRGRRRARLRGHLRRTSGWRWRRFGSEFSSRTAQPCPDHSPGESVDRDVCPVATLRANQDDVPAFVPAEPGVLGKVDDEPARTGVLRGDGHGFRSRDHPRWRRTHGDVTPCGEQEEKGQTCFHEYLNTVGSRWLLLKPWPKKHYFRCCGLLPNQQPACQPVTSLPCLRIRRSRPVRYRNAVNDAHTQPGLLAQPRRQIGWPPPCPQACS